MQLLTNGSFRIFPLLANLISWLPSHVISILPVLFLFYPDLISQAIGCRSLDHVFDSKENQSSNFLFLLSLDSNHATTRSTMISVLTQVNAIWTISSLALHIHEDQQLTLAKYQCWEIHLWLGYWVKHQRYRSSSVQATDNVSNPIQYSLLYHAVLPCHLILHNRVDKASFLGQSCSIPLTYQLALLDPHSR